MVESTQINTKYEKSLIFQIYHFHQKITDYKRMLFQAYKQYPENKKKLLFLYKKIIKKC